MSEIGVINGDSPYGEVMSATATGKVYTYGIDNEKCDYRAINIVKASDRVEYDILCRDRLDGTHVVVPIPGKFSVYNSLSAAVTAHLMGIDVSCILQGLSKVFVPGKAENVPTGRDFSVLIDYAHNPDSFINIITTVKEYAKRTSNQNQKPNPKYWDISDDELAAIIAKGHDYNFVGKVGNFCPIKPGCGGGLLCREKDGKYYAATGSKGYRWLESEMVKTLGKENDIDTGYYNSLVDAAVQTISEYGDFDWFISDSPTRPNNPPWLMECGRASCEGCPHLHYDDYHMDCGLGHDLSNSIMAIS